MDWRRLGAKPFLGTMMTKTLTPKLPFEGGRKISAEGNELNTSRAVIVDSRAGFFQTGSRLLVIYFIQQGTLISSLS